MTEEPKRLLLTENGRLGASLSVARRKVPSDQQLTGLAQRLAEAGVALPPDLLEPPPPQSAVVEAPKGESSSWLSKGVLVGAPVVGIALVALLLRSSPTVPAANENSPLSPSVAPPPAETAPVLAPIVAPPAPVNGPGRASAPAPAPRQDQPERVDTAPPAIAASPTAPVDAPAPAPTAASVVERKPRANVEGNTAPAAAPTSAPAPRVAAAAGPDTRVDDSSPELPSTGTVETEIALLKRARNTLPADPARALALTQECAERYPRGVFAQERDFIAISALFRVGRRHEAITRAERFRSAYPKSVYLPQIERMLTAP